MSRTRIHVAVGLSLLAHGMLMAIPMTHRPGLPGAQSTASPLIVRLVERRAPEVVTPLPERRLPVEKPHPRALPAERPEPAAPPTPVETVAAVETAQRPPAPQFDMLAMINARRQRREAFEDAMRRHEEALSGNASAPASDASASALQRNLQSLASQDEGTGGVFTILWKGTRTAEFAFNGWQPERHRRWREVIEVDAGPGGDVDLAIVRRMIKLIRDHYSGDFVWRSHRMGKDLVLSARLEHTRDLEDFLVREFFGTPTLGRASSP